VPGRKKGKSGKIKNRTFWGKSHSGIKRGAGKVALGNSSRIHLRKRRNGGGGRRRVTGDGLARFFQAVSTRPSVPPKRKPRKGEKRYFKLP